MIPPTGGTETDPAILRVPPGTEVVWQNRTRGAAFVRFDDPVADVCGEPIRFHRTTDSQSWASEYLAPFGEARLCFAHPGRYDFVVFISAGDGERRPVPRLRTSPTKYGTVVVEP